MSSALEELVIIILCVHFELTRILQIHARPKPVHGNLQHFESGRKREEFRLGNRRCGVESFD